MLSALGCGPERYTVLRAANSHLRVMSLFKNGFKIRQLRFPFTEEVTEGRVVTFADGIDWDRGVKKLSVLKIFHILSRRWLHGYRAYVNFTELCT